MTRDDGRREDPSLLPLVHAPDTTATSMSTPTSTTASATDTVPSVLPLIHGDSGTPNAPEVPSLLPDPGQRASTTETNVASSPDELQPASESAALPVDPRLEAVTPAISSGDWPTVLDSLGPPESASSLPPALGLVHAIAQKEADVPVSEADRDRADPTRVAIRSMAALLGVPESSPLALVLAKRLLRSNPVSWNKRKAPPVGTSILIVIVGLLLGLAAGYVISVGYVQINLPAFL